MLIGFGLGIAEMVLLTVFASSAFVLASRRTKSERVALS